jgi:hypothetical protein
VPNPYDDYDLYDQILLATTWSPGVVKLSGHDRKVDWDIKVAPGQKGATMTRKAEQPVEFTASFYLVRDVGLGLDEFAEWDEFAKLIESTVAGKTPKALVIYHPDLARVGITSVVKGTIGGMKHDDKGGATVDVKFIEYRPPQKATGSPKASPKKKDPNADVKAKLDALVTAYKKP